MKTTKTDYEYLYELLKKGPLSVRKIKEITHTTSRGVYEVILNLTYLYPIWSPEKGIIKLSERKDDELWRKGFYGEEVR